MKRKLNFLPIYLLIALAFWQCKTDETDNLSKVVDVSFPGIKLKGDSVVFLNIGDAYADAGATLTDDISGATRDIEPSEDPEIDVNAPGGYLVTFTAANANGFETTVNRLVIVRPAADAALDLTGHYQRNTGVEGAEFDVTKQGRGVYYCTNLGGVPAPSPAVHPGYFIQFEDGTIDVPLQPASNGTISCDGETASATQISWICRNPDLGTARRTFDKE